MSEPSGDRPDPTEVQNLGTGAVRAALHRPGVASVDDDSHPAGYYIGECGHRCPLVEVAPGFYRIADCREGCDDPQ